MSALGLSLLQKSILAYVWERVKYYAEREDEALALGLAPQTIPWSPTKKAELVRRITVSASLRRLENRGLLVRIRRGSRTTHVRLTAAGGEVAQRLAGEVVPAR